MEEINDLIAELGGGRAGARHALDLENALGKEEGHTQEPTIDLIREAIVFNYIPIGSSPASGYFLINTEEELAEVIEGLESRIGGLERRIEALHRRWTMRQESRSRGANWPK